jgi:hypothetical protein
MSGWTGNSLCERNRSRGITSAYNCTAVLSFPLLTVTLSEHMSVPLSLDEEARLYTTNAEREKYESLATLYGIVVALDYLERAYVRDSVTAAECVVVLRLWLNH